MPETLERGTVSLPADLSAALRNRLRQTAGPEIAAMPLGMLLRYIAAVAAGLSPQDARRYARALPRGKSKTETTYPQVPAHLRQQ